RRAAACRAVPAWELGPVEAWRGQVLAAARDRAAGRWRGRGQAVALRAEVRGQALQAGLGKGALVPAAACEAVRALANDRVDQAEILPAAVPRLASSATSSTFLGRVLEELVLAELAQAVPAAQQPTSCNKAVFRSFQPEARLWLAERWPAVSLRSF